MKKKSNNLEKVINFVVNNKAVVILAMLFLIFALATGNTFLTRTNLINVIRQVSVMGILAVGYTIIIACGGIDLSVGYMLNLCGIVVAFLNMTLGLPLPVAIIAGIACGGICGFINSECSLLLHITPFIVTLAMGQVYRGLSYVICKGAPIGNLPGSALFIGQGYIGMIPVPVVIMIIITIIMTIFINCTKPGRHIILTGGNPDAARISGINIQRVKNLAFMMVGACVAIASIVMNGRTGSAQPTAGTGMEMDAIAAVVIGGTSFDGGYGNVVGSVLGAIIVGMINNGLNLLRVNAYWQYAAKGVLIILAMVLDRMTDAVMEHQQIRTTQNNS